MTDAHDPTSSHAPTIDLSDLRSADPVRLADLRSPGHPIASELLATVVEGAPTPAGRGGNRLRMLGAVAAASAVLIGAIAIFSPAGTPSALAVVQAAAERTAAADSGRVTTSFTAEGVHDGIESSVRGEARLDYSDSNYSVTADFDPSGDLGELGLLDDVEVRLVDDVIYVLGGPAREWRAVRIPPAITSQLTEVADPRSVLEKVEQLVETTEVGPATIDGVDVTEYTSTVDLAHDTLGESGWTPGVGAAGDVDIEGTVEIALFVDTDGLLRRLTVEGELAPAAMAGGGQGSFSVVTDFTDFGSVGAIEAPAGVQPADDLSGLFERSGD